MYLCQTGNHQEFNRKFRYRGMPIPYVPRHEDGVNDVPVNISIWKCCISDVPFNYVHVVQSGLQ